MVTPPPFTANGDTSLYVGKRAYKWALGGLGASPNVVDTLNSKAPHHAEKSAAEHMDHHHA
jgi:hypothetical protein